MKVTFDFDMDDLDSLARIDDEMIGSIFEDTINPSNDALNAAKLAHEMFEKTLLAFNKESGMMPEGNKFKYPFFVEVTNFINDYILLKDLIKMYPWQAPKRTYVLRDGWLLHTDEMAKDIILTNKDDINYIFESSKPSDMTKYLEVYIADVFD